MADPSPESRMHGVAPVPLAQAWREFVAFLKGNGARITEARRIVFESVLSRRDHFRADELAAELTVGPDRVSRGTVYRVLTLLVEAGFVRTLSDGDTHAHYEQVYGRPRHEHLVCERCKRIIEFNATALLDAIDATCREKHFARAHHRVAIFGLCERCASEETKQT